MTYRFSLCAAFVAPHAWGSVSLGTISLARGQDPTTAKTSDDSEAIQRILAMATASYKTSAERESAFRKVSEGQVPPEGHFDVRFAIALTAHELKKTPYALTQLTSLSQEAPHYLPARIMLARLLIGSQKHAAGIVETESIAEQLAKSNASALTPEQREAAARFVGLIIGYYEGPGESFAKTTSFAATLAATEKWESHLQDAFAAQRAAVAEEYHQVSELGDEGMQKILERRKQLEQSAAELKNEINSRRAQVQQDAAEARRQLQTDWDQLLAQYKITWDRCSNLMQNVTNLRQQEGLLQANLSVLLNAQANRPPGGNQNQPTVDPNQIAQIQFSISRIQGQIFPLLQQYEQLRSVGANLEAKMSLVQAESQRLGMALQQAEQSFRQLDKEAKQKETAAQNTEPKKSASALRRERAFATYDDYNFHREKKLLIEATQPTGT